MMQCIFGIEGKKVMKPSFYVPTCFRNILRNVFSWCTAFQEGIFKLITKKRDRKKKTVVVYRK